MSLILDDLQAWSLDPQTAVSPQLRRILRSRIIRNDLKPNTKISEPELAKQYRVSRQPVREAFITLENEGLVEVRPQRGTFVRRIDYEAVLNGRFVREAVEADIVKTLARDPSPAPLASLRAQLDAQETIARTDPARFIELDEQFHHALADAAGFTKAWDYLDTIKAQMDRVRFISFEEFPVATLIDQHRRIVDAIERGDVENADNAIRRHLREILNSMPPIQALYPDYFENSRAVPFNSEPGIPPKTTVEERT